MSEGNHVLTIRKEGFLSKDLSVSVAAGRKSYWAPVPLAPAP
jgi:hypothetical protein